jgi:hypothetical protein
VTPHVILRRRWFLCCLCVAHMNVDVVLLPYCYVIRTQLCKAPQSKVLPIIVDAPWYVPSSLIRRDLSCPTVKEEIRRYTSHYGDRLRTHPNHLAVNLLRLPGNRRLRRFLLTDLPDKF